MGNNSRGQLSVDIHAQVSIAWFYCQMPFVFLKQRKWTPVFRWGSWRTWVLSQSAIVSFSPDLEPILYDKKKKWLYHYFCQSSQCSIFSQQSCLWYNDPCTWSVSMWAVVVFGSQQKRYQHLQDMPWVSIVLFMLYIIPGCPGSKSWKPLYRGRNDPPFFERSSHGKSGGSFRTPVPSTRTVKARVSTRVWPRSSSCGLPGTKHSTHWRSLVGHRRPCPNSETFGDRAPQKSCAG